MVLGLHVELLEALVGFHVELELPLGHGVPLDAVAGLHVDLDLPLGQCVPPDDVAGCGNAECTTSGRSFV